MTRQAISPRLAIRTLRIAASAEIARHRVLDAAGDLDGVGRVGMDADAIGANGHVLTVDGGDLPLLHRTDGARRGLLGIDRVMLARDDEVAVIVVIEIGVILRD